MHVLRYPWEKAFHDAYEQYAEDWHEEFRNEAKNANPKRQAYDAQEWTKLLSDCVGARESTLKTAWDKGKGAKVYDMTKKMIRDASAIARTVLESLDPITSYDWALEELWFLIDLGQSLQGQNITMPWYDATGNEINVTMVEGVYADYVNLYLLPNGSVVENPELTPRLLAFDPIIPRPGETVNITAVIGNFGAAVDNVRVDLLIDNVLIGSQNIYLDRVCGELVTWPWIAEYGAHNITIVVDPNNDINEACTNGTQTILNKDNNVLEHQVFIDNIPPNISINSPTQRNYYVTESTTLDFSASDDSFVLDTYGFIDKLQSDMSNLVFSGETIPLSDYGIGYHTFTAVSTDFYNNTSTKTIRFTVLPQPSVGGTVVPVDTFGLLAPYIGLASTISVATVAAAVYVRRVNRRKEKR